MASITIKGGDRFPDGTTVSVYVTPALPLSDGAPSGSVVTTGTFSSGTVTFTGLADATSYVAYAQVGGVGRYERFRTDVAPTSIDIGNATFTGVTAGQVPSWDAVAAKFVARELGFGANVKLPPYNAIGDGTSHPLSERYATLGAAQAVYPHATALTDEIDWAAWQLAVNNTSSTLGGVVYGPHGAYVFNRALTVDKSLTALVGEGTSTKITLAAGSNSNTIRFNTTSDTSSAGAIRKSRILMRDLYIDHQGHLQAATTGGADGCVVATGIDHFRAENVTIKNSRNSGFELRASTIVRFLGCTIDGVAFGSNANAFNVGKTGNVTGQDVMFSNCVVSGCQDVAFWTGGDGAHRLSVQGCIVRSDTTKTVTDGAVTSGSGTFTSATAAFTANDVGKVIVVQGAGAAGAALTCRVFSFTNATTIALSVLASTTVSGATFAYGLDDAPAREVFDGVATSGSATVTSATAAFTSADVGRGVYFIGAAAASADLRGWISTVNSATSVTLNVTAGTNVASGGHMLVNTTNSGIVSEGSSGNSDYISMVGCHVVGTVNSGIGVTDAASGTTGSKHDQVTISACTVSETYGTAAVTVTGTNIALNAVVVRNFHTSGIWIGGNDFNEYGYTLTGVEAHAASDATGNGLTITKPTTNWLERVTLNGCHFFGNGGGSRGVSVQGHVRIFSMLGGSISKWKNSGFVAVTSGGFNPTHLKLIGVDSRNNNQAANATGVNSVGFNIDASCDLVTMIGCTGTDDQGSPTQTHGLRWGSGATRGKITANDFRGNLTGPLTVAFDSKTVYDGNFEVDDLYKGSVTLSGGTATVNTAAAINSGANSTSFYELSVATPGGTQGALFVSAVVSGTSFTIKSTSASDTSVVRWRIT